MVLFLFIRDFASFRTDCGVGHFVCYIRASHFVWVGVGVAYVRCFGLLIFGVGVKCYSFCWPHSCMEVCVGVCPKTIIFRVFDGNGQRKTVLFLFFWDFC
jgi:hypothetical protein